MGNKGRRLITIEPDLDQKLSNEENASGLIDRLLREHFNAEISQDIDYLQKKREELEEEIEIKAKRLDRIKEQINKVIEQTNKNKEKVEELEEQLKTRRRLKNLLSSLIKEKHITFNEYMVYRENPQIWKDLEDLENQKLTIKEFLEKQKV